MIWLFPAWCRPRFLSNHLISPFLRRTHASTIFIRDLRIKTISSNLLNTFRTHTFLMLFKDSKNLPPKKGPGVRLPVVQTLARGQTHQKARKVGFNMAVSFSGGFYPMPASRDFGHLFGGLFPKECHPPALLSSDFRHRPAQASHVRAQREVFSPPWSRPNHAVGSWLDKWTVIQAGYPRIARDYSCHPVKKLGFFYHCPCEKVLIIMFVNYCYYLFNCN